VPTIGALSADEALESALIPRQSSALAMKMQEMSDDRTPRGVRPIDRVESGPKVRLS
jgi:hypothetical protein